jgi:isoquinoline 1-oxidoreductase alpha subunit
MANLRINGRDVTVDADPDTPLLWVLRDHVDLTGTKFGCGAGLSRDGSHPVQQAWLAEQVPQCGYCQPGMIMAAAALLADTPQPSEADIDAAMTNLCRCGTYDRVRRAIHRAAQA